MPEHEFDIYLTLLAKTLRLDNEQRDAIAAELRDHLEQRLDELTEQGLTREQAIEAALAEFGDASALANDLTKTNPARIRARRHFMQTTFGTVITCAAVTFAIMLLTPNNKDGQPNQPAAVAQDDAFGGVGGEFENGGEDFGGGDAFEGGGDFGGGDFDAFGGELGGAAAPAKRLQLAIHVVDCTEILRADRNRGDLLERTAALANAVERTVATVNEHGERAIRVQPFEEFLIITATDSAYEEAANLLEKIGTHVERRTTIQDQHERERAKEQRAREEQRAELKFEMDRVAAQIDRHMKEHAELAARRAQLLQKHGQDHPDVQQVSARIEAMQAEIRELQEIRIHIERRVRTHP